MRMFYLPGGARTVSWVYQEALTETTCRGRSFVSFDAQTSSVEMQRHIGVAQHDEGVKKVGGGCAMGSEALVTEQVIRAGQ